jgi:hypothetical protein
VIYVDAEIGSDWLASDRPPLSGPG